MTLKLVHNKDADAKALGKKITQRDKSITNGAISKYGDIVKADYQEGICGHIEWTVSPLAHAANNATAYALDALKAGRTLEDKNKALRIMRETLLRGLDQYEDLLEIKRLDHETTDPIKPSA